MLASMLTGASTRMRSGFPAAVETSCRKESKPRSAPRQRSAAIATSDGSASKRMDAPAQLQTGDDGAGGEMNNRLGVVDPILRRGLRQADELFRLDDRRVARRATDPG